MPPARCGLWHWSRERSSNGLGMFGKLSGVKCACSFPKCRVLLCRENENNCELGSKLEISHCPFSHHYDSNNPKILAPIPSLLTWGSRDCVWQFTLQSFQNRPELAEIWTHNSNFNIVAITDVFIHITINRLYHHGLRLVYQNCLLMIESKS